MESKLFFYVFVLTHLNKLYLLISIRGDHFWFSSVFTHKKQPSQKKTKQNRTETGRFNRPVSVLVRFFMPKTEKTYMFFRLVFSRSQLLGKLKEHMNMHKHTQI